jgi:hypothetical protein
MKPKMQIGAQLEMVVEPRLSQHCKLCHQEVVAERQTTINAIVIWDHSMCPSCRQGVDILRRNDPRYRRKWRKFINGVQLDK